MQELRTHWTQAWSRLALPPPAGLYEQQIRQEYAWVPRLLYNRKRRSVLQAFLARARIYSTSAFGIRFEAQARANLAEAVRALAFW